MGYGSLLGAIGAVMVASYWILRRQLDLADLYKTEGRYASYCGGWDLRAIATLLVGVIPSFLRAATTLNFSGVFENPTLAVARIHLRHASCPAALT